MSETVVIRSKNQLWNDFIIRGLQENVSKIDIQANLIDAMRKEIFGQMMLRMKVDDIRDAPQTPENEKIVLSISDQAHKKWVSLVKECRKYKETMDIIAEDDLTRIWDDEEEMEEV